MNNGRALMKTILKAIKKSVILTACIDIIVGIALLVYPETSSTVLCYCVGGVVLLYGLISLIRHFRNKDGYSWLYLDLVLGIILCGIGLFMIIFKDVVISAIPYIFGLFLFIDGVFMIQRAVGLKRLSFRKWWYVLIMALLTVGMGLVMMFHPFDAAMIMVIYIGITLIFDGVFNLITAFFMHRAGKVVRDIVEDSVEKVIPLDYDEEYEPDYDEEYDPDQNSK